MITAQEGDGKHEDQLSQRNPAPIEWNPAQVADRCGPLWSLSILGHYGCIRNGFVVSLHFLLFGSHDL